MIVVTKDPEMIQLLLASGWDRTNGANEFIWARQLGRC